MLGVRGLLGRVAPGEAPLDPDAREARRWAEEELAKAEYSAEPSIWERMWQWFVDMLDKLIGLGGPTPPNVVPLLVVCGVAAALALAIYVAGPVRLRRRRAERDSFAVFDDATQTSADLHQAADEAAGSEDFAQAVLLRFRAIIRSLDDRGVLADRAGLTAHEASTEAGTRLPEQARGLRWAGQLFDAVCYGSARPRESDDRTMRELADGVARARPVPTSPPRVDMVSR